VTGSADRGRQSVSDLSSGIDADGHLPEFGRQAAQKASGIVCGAEDADHPLVNAQGLTVGAVDQCERDSNRSLRCGPAEAG